MTISGDYQYKAMYSKSSVRSFWHCAKLILVDELGLNKKGIIICDAGCGSGNLSFHLSKSAKKVVGVDISPQCIDFCKNTAKAKGIANVKFIGSTLEALPLKGAYFDIVLFFEVIEHLSANQINNVLLELRRILKKDGKLVLTTPNYNSFWPLIEFVSDLFKLSPKMRGDQHVTRFNNKRLKATMMKSNFKVEKLGTFLGLSPFLNVFSESCALRALKHEIKSSKNSNLIYCVAKK